MNSEVLFKVCVLGKRQKEFEFCVLISIGIEENHYQQIGGINQNSRKNVLSMQRISVTGRMKTLTVYKRTTPRQIHLKMFTKNERI